MGWWKIDPATGKPAEKTQSKLSRPPEFTLLNAVPGVDDEDEAHYLGDGPWDMVYSHVGKIEELIGNAPRPTKDEARRLFVDRVFPPSLAGLPAAARKTILHIVAEMWDDIDWCYDEDWERPARPAEKRWLAESAVQQLTDRPD